MRTRNRSDSIISIRTLRKPSGRTIALFALVGLVMVVGSWDAMAASAGDCVRQLRSELAGEPAFRVSCTAERDCEFEPSLARNASAMAVLDQAAARLKACWLKAGLANQVRIQTPTSMKVLVHRFSAQTSAREVCTIAELKPFGLEALTTSFRAQCQNR